MAESIITFSSGQNGNYVGFESDAAWSLGVPMGTIDSGDPDAIATNLSLLDILSFTGPPTAQLILILGGPEVPTQDAFSSLSITSDSGPQTFDPAEAVYETDTSDGNVAIWTWPLAEMAFSSEGPPYTLTFTYTPTPTGINYNCDCDDVTGYETLAQLRARLMVRLGYAGQVNNPPPGMAALLNDFLVSSQRLLYMKYNELRTERFFTWNVEAGERLFDIGANDGDTCTKRLNALKLSWVGMEDLTTPGTWYPLISGIPPEFYTSISSPGMPTRYEIRQCIEIFPVPERAYKLRIKGHFKLQPLVADADQTTIDSELVFMWALATAKAHYGHPDANNCAAMANDYLGRLVAGRHGTKRYVPGATPATPWQKPTMRDGFDA